MDARDPLVAALREVVGAAQVLVEPSVVAGHAVDWTGRFRAEVRCVVRPGDAAQTARCLALCVEHDVPVTPQGGNTGLVGGGVPVDGGVVLSTTGLQSLGEVDRDGTVVVGAGVSLACLQAHAATAGWAVGVDLASRDSATIGGMVATDAGGARVVLHGSMRDQVRGLEVALADGHVATPWLGGTRKDTAGYRLDELLVGSEGTLGVVTRVRLQLVRPVTPSATLLLGAVDGDALVELVGAVRRLVGEAPAVQLTACEFVAADGLAAAARTLGVAPPVTTAFAVLVELAGAVDDDLLGGIAENAEGDDGAAAVLAVDEGDRRRLWTLRERHAEVVNALGVPVKLDVAVPPRAFGRLLDEVGAVADGAVAGARTILFGHAAEANVHVNVLLPGVAPGTAPDEPDAAAVEAAVVDLVTALGGTVSAEHGVGRAKVPHLHRTRDAATIAAMRAIKDALDPTGVLNPGVVLPVLPEARP